jgi:O-antigen/teichoic acid export membrane protein
MPRRPTRILHLRDSLPAWTRLWAADSALLTLSQGLTVVSSAAVAVIVARHLDPHLWGLFAGLLGLALGASLVVEFGLGTWLLRELSRPSRAGTDEAARLLGGAAGISGAIGTTILVGSVATSFAFGSSAGTQLAISMLVLYGLLLASATILESYLRARRLVLRVFACSAIEKAVLVVLVLSVVLADGGLVTLTLAYLASGVVRVLAAAYFVLLRERLRPVAPTVREAVAFARRGLPFVLTTASVNVIPRFDALILFSLSSSSAAYFAIGERVLLPGLVAAGALSVTLYPFLSGGASLRVGLRLSATAAAVGALVCILGIVAAPPLVPLLFGSEYEDAVPVVRVMFLLIPFVFATGALLTHLYSLGHERAILAVTLGMSLIGTGAIVAGQLVSGPVLAASGAVLRQALFLLALIALAVVAARSSLTEGGVAVPPDPR